MALTDFFRQFPEQNGSEKNLRFDSANGNFKALAGLKALCKGVHRYRPGHTLRWLMSILRVFALN